MAGEEMIMDVNTSSAHEKVPISCEMIPPFANLHGVYPTQAGIERKAYRWVPPSHSIEATGPIEFVIPSGSDEQIYPAGIRIYTVVKICDEMGGMLPGPVAGAAAAAGAPAVLAHINPLSQVFPVDGLGSSLFQDIEVWLNTTKITSFDGLYGYRADLQKRLFSSIQNKKHSMKLGGTRTEREPLDKILETRDGLGTDAEKLLFMNGVFPFAEVDDEAYNNWGADHFKKSANVWKKRHGDAYRSQLVRYFDRIYSEIFNQTKLLPPGAKLSIVLGRSDFKFCLLSPHADNRYRIVIETCKLHVPIVKTEAAMVNEIKYQSFQGNLMRYPIRRVELTTFAFGRLRVDLSIPNIIQGIVTPRRIFIVLIDSEALHGHLCKDPFNYQHFNLREMGIKLGGLEGGVPEMKMEDLGQYKNITAVQALLNTLGSENTFEEVGIDLDNFSIRNNIYAFDINGCAGVELVNAYTKEERLPTGVHIMLNGPLDKNITVLVYKEFDAEITCDSAGEFKVSDYA